MPRGKKFTAEQIIGKLRAAEVALAAGSSAARTPHARCRCTDLGPWIRSPNGQATGRMRGASHRLAIVTAAARMPTVP